MIKRNNPFHFKHLAIPTLLILAATGFGQSAWLQVGGKGLTLLQVPENRENLLGAPVSQPFYMVNAKGDYIYPTAISATARGFRYETPGGFLEVVLGSRGDTQTVALSGKGKGVRAIGFKFRVKAHLGLLVPGGRNGLEYHLGDLPREERFIWPRRWEAPVVVGEGARGCFALWVEDPSHRSKILSLSSNQGEIMVACEVENDAPFEDKTEITAPTFYVRTSAGPYTAALDPYKTWMTAQYLSQLPLTQNNPAARVEAMVLLPSLRDELQAQANIKLMAALAGELDPQKTMLWTATWYDDESYKRKPDNPTPVAGYKAMNEAAHSLGFLNLSYISSYAAITPASKVWAECQPYLYNDEKTGKPMFYGADRVPHYMVNALSPAMQRAHIETISNMVRNLAVDIVSFEQTSATWNVNGATHGGKTGIHGLVEMHEAITKAVPQGQLAAEGMADLLLPYHRFYQTHVWQGIYEPSKQMAFPALGLAHPISSYLFSPAARKIGFLDVVPPTSSFYWEALKPAFIRWGVVPSLRIERSNALTRVGMQAALAEARLWQRAAGDTIFASKRSDLVALTLKGPKTSGEYRIESDGSYECLETGDNPQPIFSITRHRGELSPGKGTIPWWPAVSGGRALGLDPDAWYLALGKPPAEGAGPTLSQLAPGAIITRHYRRASSLAVFFGGSTFGKGVMELKTNAFFVEDFGLPRPIAPGIRDFEARNFLAVAEAIPTLMASQSLKDLLFSSHGIMGGSGQIDTAPSALEKDDLRDHPPCSFQNRTENGIWLVPLNFGSARSLLLFKTEKPGKLTWNPQLCLARDSGLTGIVWGIRLDGSLKLQGKKKSGGWESLSALESPLAAGVHSLEIEVGSDGRWDGDMAFMGGRVFWTPE